MRDRYAETVMFMASVSYEMAEKTFRESDGDMGSAVMKLYNIDEKDNIWDRYEAMREQLDVSNKNQIQFSPNIQNVARLDDGAFQGRFHISREE